MMTMIQYENCELYTSSVDLTEDERLSSEDVQTSTAKRQSIV